MKKAIEGSLFPYRTSHDQLLLDEGTYFVGESVLSEACHWFHLGTNQPDSKDVNQGCDFDLIQVAWLSILR